MNDKFVYELKNMDDSLKSKEGNIEEALTKMSGDDYEMLMMQLDNTLHIKT